MRMLFPCVFLLACAGAEIEDDDDGSSSGTECGDLDGPGTETGNLPNILGTWTTTFGSQTDYENCDIEGLKQSDMGWINGAAMEIDGRPPDQLYATFSDDEEELFWGLESTHGGVVFSGVHEMKGYELHVSFGGLLFYNDLLGRDEIKGHGFMGIDVTEDGWIDCGLQGDFSAKKSGN